MSQPTLTLEQIRSRATDKIFARGEAYYWDDAIFDTVKRGSTIEGFCAASSQPEPYHVTAALSENGIIETSCTCPYDYEGVCKHVIALLLNYVRRAQVFEERATIDTALNVRSKDELIALVQKMLTYYPDLKAVVDGRPHFSEQQGEDDDHYDQDYD